MSKEEAIAKLIPVFTRYGYEGATLTRLSEATGLGKSSLYHYFPKGKEEIATAVLEHVKDCVEKTILAPLRTSGKPKERLESMCQSLNEFYDQGQQSCLLNVISLGEGEELFHASINQALKTWIEEITKVLISAGIESNLAKLRAEEAVILIQGSLVLARGLKDTKPFQRVIESLPQRLLK